MNGFEMAARSSESHLRCCWLNVHAFFAELAALLWGNINAHGDISPQALSAASPRYDLTELWPGPENSQKITIDGSMEPLRRIQSIRFLSRLTLS